MDGDVLRAQLDYWKGTLSGAPRLLELPAYKSRPDLQTFRGAVRSALVDVDCAGALKALSDREGASLFMTLLAACSVLLNRYTRQEDIVVGTNIANRNRGDSEGLIGLFVGNLPLRTDLSGNPTFFELLARVRDVCLEAYAHQDVPFEKLVDE